MPYKKYPNESNIENFVVQSTKYRIPIKEDLEKLQSEMEELVEYLKEQQTHMDSISEAYALVEASPVCSIANRNFNTLEEQYFEYIDQIKLIQERIEELQRQYDKYVETISRIPLFSRTLREEKTAELEEVITPKYTSICQEKERYLLELEEAEKLYLSAKKIADDFFNEYYDFMCHIVNAEAGYLDYSKAEGLYTPEEIEYFKSMERCYVANVIENRIKSPKFKENTLVTVVKASGQYAPVKNGSINIKPYPQTRIDMENYLRGHVDTGMPDNVLYQATFKQGKVWEPPTPVYSGHIFCYG